MTRAIRPKTKSERAPSGVITAQGEPRTLWLRSKKHGYMVHRPRRMKGMVWDYIVDLKLNVDPKSHRFKPKTNLARGLTSGLFYDLRKPLEAAGYRIEVYSW